MPLRARAVLARVGAIVYGVAGGVIGAQNADVLGAERDANALLPLLGRGGGLVIIAARSSPFHEHVSRSLFRRVAG